MSVLKKIEFGTGQNNISSQVPMMIKQNNEPQVTEEPGESSGQITTPMEHIETRRYPQREIQIPVHLRDYELGRDTNLDEEEDVTYHAFFADSDPVTFEEATNGSQWIQAMDEEIHAIEKNNTWELLCVLNCW